MLQFPLREALTFDDVLLQPAYSEFLPHEAVIDTTLESRPPRGAIIAQHLANLDSRGRGIHLPHRVIRQRIHQRIRRRRALIARGKPRSKADQGEIGIIHVIASSSRRA